LDFGNYVIYVYESGDHSLEVIDQYFSVFVLDFCIFQKDHYYSSIVPKVQAFKFQHFGHDLVVLHEHDIRKQKPPFVFLKTQAKRIAFMEGLNEIIEGTDFTIVAAVIDKYRLTHQYAYPENPYDIALCFCMERAYAFLRDQGEHTRQTHIVVEKRGKREDDALKSAFRSIRDSANHWGPMHGFEIVFADKRANSTGLQFSDLTTRPITQHTLDPAQPNRAYEIINTKFRQGPAGVVKGWGLKTFP